MSDSIYDVVFEGRVAPGHDKEKVRSALLSKRLLPGEALDRALGGEPIRIGTGISHQEAGRLRDGYRQAGALCRIVPHTGGGASRQAGSASGTDGSASGDGRRTISPLLLVVGGVILLVGFLALRGRSPRNERTAPASSAEPQQASGGLGAPGLQQTRSEELWVAPGETRSFEVVGHLPFVHRDDVSLSVEAPFKVTANSLETLGLQASFEGASIDSVTVTLWEYVDSAGRAYVPGLTPGGLGMATIANPTKELNERFAATAFFRGEVSKAIANGEATEEAFRQGLSGLDVSGVQRRSFRAYLARLRFSLSVPASPEFGADHRGSSSIWFGSDGVQLDYPEGRVAASLRTDALIELARGGPRPGVRIVNVAGGERKDWVVAAR